MICKIANLGVEVPELGNLPQRCKPYEADVPVDITLDAAKIRSDIYKTISAEDNYYVVSGYYFYRQLLRHDGMMLHASAVVVDGYAYLFSGPCGMGKSTHAAMYKKAFPDATIINDDKPALRAHRRHLVRLWYPLVRQGRYQCEYLGPAGRYLLSAPGRHVAALHYGAGSYSSVFETDWWAE